MSRGSSAGPAPEPERPATWPVRTLRRLVRRISPHAALVIILVLGLIPALLLTVGSAEVYESVVESDGVAGLDAPVLDAALALRSPEWDSAVTAFTNLAGPVGMPVLAGLAVAVLSVLWRSWTPLLLVGAAAAGSLLMTVAGKALVGRARPPLQDAVPPYEYSASFPSGHTLNSVVIAGTVAYLVVLQVRRRRSKILAVAVAALFAGAVGLSRVYLGHHWLTDVLVAWTLGLAWLAVLITAHQLFLARRRSRARPAPTGDGPAGGAADSPG